MDLLLKSAGGTPSASEWIKDTTTQTFMKDVVEASMRTPVLLDFWATWCGPCKQFVPLLEKVVNAAKGAVRLVKVDIDRFPEIAQQFGVQSVPTIIIFQNGQPLDGFAGVIPESQLKLLISKLTGADPTQATSEDMLKLGQEMLASGQFPQAIAAFQQVLATEPESPEAIGGAARALIALGKADQAAEVLNAVSPQAAATPAIQGARTLLALLQEGGQDINPAQLQAAIAKNPDDFQARYDLALALFVQSQPEAAMDELLTIFAKDRAWNEEAARLRLLKFFEALGHTHPLTVAWRKKLSTLMFS